ncbi:DNA repair protein RAD16 [Dispira simplex]|nr:DNA repair protein RAD16 [Dispira simplex]
MVQLLPFQKRILSELNEEDGLLVLAKGLGLSNILVHLLSAYADPRLLVLLLNTPNEEETYYRDTLARLGVARASFRIVKNDTNAQERSELYRRGGVLSITSRILVVDMLTQRIPMGQITGVLVNHAHQVDVNSSEAFILRLLRENNKEAFIKAFCEAPERLAVGFSPLEKTLKALRIRKAFLWPRFHVEIANDLEQRRVEVVELRQPLTPTMREIQLAILDCIQLCIAELRRFHRLVDLEEITVENALTRAFDILLRRQLDPLWHRLSARTKQLVSDITTLRRLVTYLVSYDCVSFYEFLETLMASHTTVPNRYGAIIQSPWLLTDAADLLFRFARDRVYRPCTTLTPVQSSLLESKGLPPRILPVLEEQPKWSLLQHILDEIYAHRALLAKEQDQDQTGSKSQTGPVLIMTSTFRATVQVQEFLANLHEPVLFPLDTQTRNNGKESAPAQLPTRFDGYLFQQLRSYFRWKNQVYHVTAASAPSSSGTTVNDQRTSSPTPLQRTGSNRAITTSVRLSQPVNKRRRVRGGAQPPAVTHASSSTATSTAPPPDSQQALSTFFQGSAESTPGESSSAAASLTNPVQPFTDELYVDPTEFSETFGLLPTNQLVLVRNYQGESDLGTLWETQPQFIIMYDPNPIFIRQVELYQALNPERFIRVYFIVYDDSAEEQVYLTAVRKEKEAFEKLVHERSVMVIPLESILTAKTLAAGRYERDLATLRSLNTRIAGGGQVLHPDQTESIVVIDVREFRSALPPVLHGEGFVLQPCTLIVGDYVLSPTVCVERKSITDLINSFSSGRLYTQVETMRQYYSTPVLLIEFESGRSFSLQGLGDLKSDIALSDLSSKLVLLTLAFPSLRIFWSSSPKATAEMFWDLKKNQPGPDLVKAMRVGSNTEEEVGTSHNLTPLDMLQSLPGITSKNYRYVAKNVKNIQELCELSVGRLKSLLGNIPGQRLYDFIHRKGDK